MNGLGKKMVKILNGGKICQGRGRSWRTEHSMETNTRDPKGQVTNSWDAAQHKLAQHSIPPSQTSSNLSAGESSWHHINTIERAAKHPHLYTYYKCDNFNPLSQCPTFVAFSDSFLWHHLTGRSRSNFFLQHIIGKQKNPSYFCMKSFACVLLVVYRLRNLCNSVTVSSADYVSATNTIFLGLSNYASSLQLASPCVL